MAFAGREIVEKPNLAIGFLALFACVFLIALRAAWWMTFHLFFQALAKLLDVSLRVPHVITLHPFGFLAVALRRADDSMMHWIGVGIDRTAHAFIEFALWIAYTLTMIGVAVAAIGYELGLQGVRLIERTALPHIKPIVKTVTHEVTQTVTRIRVAADSRVPALARKVAALEARLEHVATSIALPAPVTIPRELPKVGQLEHAWDWTQAKAGSLSKLGTVAGLVGLAAAVLGRLGLGWVRCSKVGRVGRGVCGMNNDLLESLLADALLIVGAVSVVEFAKELQTIEAATVSAMRGFVREL